jgi:hypothetical protein
MGVLDTAKIYTTNIILKEVSSDLTYSNIFVTRNH